MTVSDRRGGELAAVQPGGVLGQKSTPLVYKRAGIGYSKRPFKLNDSTMSDTYSKILHVFHSNLRLFHATSRTLGLQISFFDGRLF